MNVLVTGGAGYVGSHTCKLLANSGYHPFTLDNLCTGHSWAVKWGPLIEADIRDTSSVVKAMKSHKIEAVIHFAAHAYVGESVVDPHKYYNNNVAGTISLLGAMREAQVSKIVFSSTCATYGIPTRVPITEAEPQRPVNPYGHTKLMVEHILRNLCEVSDLEATALRYFNASGADQDLEVGEDHRPETHLIPLAIAAASGGQPLKIFGNDYPTSDGTCVRDYIHVSDLAQAHVSALKVQSTDSNSRFRAFNLGSENGFSVMDIVNSVEQLTGSKVQRSFADRRAGDPPQLVASSEKARKDLNWMPRHSEIDHIVGTAIQWYKKHF